MAVGYKLIGNNKLIPRLTFQGRRRSYIKTDLTNPFENQGTELVYTPFDVEECVVQPMSGRAVKDYTAQLMSEGGKEYDAFTVYSTTQMHGLKEGTLQMCDQVFLPDSRGEMAWFTVIKCDPYPSSGVTRYRSFVVTVPEGTEGGM